MLTFHYLIGRHWTWLVWPYPLSHDWNHESVDSVRDVMDVRNLLALVVWAVGLCTTLPGLLWVWRQFTLRTVPKPESSSSEEGDNGVVAVCRDFKFK